MHKSKAEYAQYYRNSLLYLACVKLEDLSKEERISRAHDLGIAALLGDTIYNFGELLLHPILQDLKGTQYEWLQNLLFAFNAGSLGKFESLIPYLEQQVRTRSGELLKVLVTASMLMCLLPPSDSSSSVDVVDAVFPTFYKITPLLAAISSPLSSHSSHSFLLPYYPLH